MGVAALLIGLHRGEEGLQVVDVGLAQPLLRDQPFLPFAEIEQALLGVRDQLVGIVERLAVLPAGDDAELFEQMDDALRLDIGQRQIMCAERVGGDTVAPAPRIATGTILEFEQAEVLHPGIGERPGRGKACDAAADDRDPGLYRLARIGEFAAAQPVPAAEIGAAQRAGDGVVTRR